MNKKRFRAFGLAVVFALSVVFPVRQANALVPLVGLAVAAASNTGAIVTADLLTSGVTALIGGTIAALYLTPNNAEAPTRVALMSDQPTIDAVMPPPVNPGTVQANTTYMFCGGTMSAEGCCSQNVSVQSQSWSSWGGSCSGGGVSGSGGNMICSYSCTDNYGPRQFTTGMTGSAVQNCPSGSSWNGSTCTVTDTRQAVPDSKKDYIPSAAGFSSPDADSVPSYVVPSEGAVYAKGTNSSGQPVMIKYAVSADGTKTYVTHYTQSEDAAQTTVKTQSITVDTATGVVTAGTIGTAAGSISPGATAGSVPTVATGAAVTSGSSNVQPLVLPTDYARAGEAASAASSINTKLDTLHRDLTEKGADVADPVSPDAAAFSSAFFSGTFADLLSWRLPAHTSECPTVTFDYMMFSSHQVHHMDSQCTIAEQIRPVLSVVMVVVWTIVALFVLLEA